MWKIVAIDDDFHVLRGMKAAIPWQEWGFDWVGEATDGHDGLRLIQDVRPDVVISDIYMPDMTGLDMIEKLREGGFQGEIVILSGYNDFEYARQALRLQVNDYLSKPISIHDFKKVLQDVSEKLEEKYDDRAEKEEISRKLHQYEPFVTKEWIKSLVTGTYSCTSDIEIPATIDPVHWENCHYLVIGIELKRTDKLRASSLADWNLYRFAISNIIQEVIHEEWASSYFIEMHSYHSAVLLQSEPQETAETIAERALQLARTMIRCVETYMKLRINIGIGSLKLDFKHISLSTEEAFREIMFHKNEQDGSCIYKFQSGLGSSILSENQSYMPIRSLQYYHKIAESLLVGKKELALEELQQFSEMLATFPGVGEAQFRHLATELWSVIGLTFYNSSRDLSEVLDESTIPNQVDQIVTAQQLHSWVCNLIELVSQSRSWNEFSKHKQTIDLMLQHIHEHYNQDFTLEDLSVKLYLTPNYLSRIFKKVLGESFNNYLIRIRIEKAKALLAEGKLMIYEVAERVGYRNIPYFSSLFKKYTGLNPSDFAKGK